jgi:MOSC domain-containing protein YiiM
MTGTVLQINVSPGGLPKRPIAEAVVTAEGIRGDSWAHPNIHGGPNQALLLITSEGIDELIAQGFPLYLGALGENLTTEGLDRRQMRPGQRYRAGEVVVELTELRVPCETLDVYGPAIKKAIYDAQIQAGDPSSPRWGLSGFYARVLQPGPLRSRDIIKLLDQVV